MVDAEKLLVQLYIGRGNDALHVFSQGCTQLSPVHGAEAEDDAESDALHAERG